MAGSKYQFDTMAMSIAVEAVSGTFIAPTTVLPIERGSGSPEPKFDTDVSDPVNKYHGSKETTVNTDYATLEYSAKMKLPSNHALIAPAFAMCGVVGSAITGGTAYAYNTDSDSTASIVWTEERTTTEVRGARADFTLTMETKKAVEIDFSIKSILKQVVDLATADANNTIPTAPDISSVFMKNDCSVYLVNGQSARFKKVVLSLKAEVIVPDEMCAISCYTKDTAPELQISSPLTEENEASFDDLKNGTEFNFVIPLYDVTGVKKYELLAPKCVVVTQKKSESDRKLNVERTLECRRVSVDDAWELKAYD